MSTEMPKQRQEEQRRQAQARPAYEPPRVTKKRSVSRATLFSGAGAAVQGVVVEGPP